MRVFQIVCVSKKYSIAGEKRPYAFLGTVISNDSRPNSVGSVDGM